MNRKRITVERLRTLVSYDKATGLFTRLHSSGGALHGAVPSYINRCGHVEFRLENELYKAHMLAWLWVYGEWPKHRLVHLNGVKHDNRIENLAYSAAKSGAAFDCARARYLFDYNSETGVFTRRVRMANQPAGSLVGCAGKRGYIVANIDGRLYYMHRVAWLYMTGEWPRLSIDHKNRIRTDNRWDNLRLAESYQNACNTTRKRRSNTGVPNVYYSRRTGLYVAEVRHNSMRVLCASFKSLDAARVAAEEAKAKYHAEFRTTNNWVNHEN